MTPSRREVTSYTKVDGTLILPVIFSRIFDRADAKLPFPVISLHDLLHTHARWLQAGVSRKPEGGSRTDWHHKFEVFAINLYHHLPFDTRIPAADMFSIQVDDQSNETAYYHSGDALSAGDLERSSCSDAWPT